MEKAGYLGPSEESGGRRRGLAAFAIDDLIAEEEEELLKDFAFLRTPLVLVVTLVLASLRERSRARSLG